jgi:sodium transport system ATP-binding protein
MIEVNAISKQYTLNKKQRAELHTQADTIQAVQDVSFRCEPGQVFSLLGPNGAGKTTTLRMIATLLKPSTGSISVAGFDAQQQPEEVRRRIGFLTGATNLYDRLTPPETMRYFAELYKIPKAVYEPRMDQLFTRLGIDSFRNKRIGQLSTGMKQKVSIARTMIHDPEVVIFDEPTSGLDVITANNIIMLIRECRAAGKTVIFSSHIMSEVDMLCDNLAIINNGRLIFSGSMDSFRAEAAADSLTEAFIRIVTTR